METIVGDYIGTSIGIHSPTPYEAPDSKGPLIDPSIDPFIGSLSRNPEDHSQVSAGV